MTADDPTRASGQESGEQFTDDDVSSRRFGGETASLTTQQVTHHVDPAEVKVDAWHYGDEPETSTVELCVDVGDRRLRISYKPEDAQALGEKIAAAGRFAAGDHTDEERDR